MARAEESQTVGLEAEADQRSKASGTAARTRNQSGKITEAIARHGRFAAR